MEERYLIIADDFTGANDTGVQLRRRGFPTEVLFCGKPMGADRSIVIDTESRNVHQIMHTRSYPMRWKM